ncbi:hypothetical protein DP033_20435 [Escherichia coli]|nr:hypothetical protein [Escherichia coli]PTN26667.1 hypothetical protein A7589_09490 [Escherichia sp. MOD1-EC6475]
MSGGCDAGGCGVKVLSLFRQHLLPLLFIYSAVFLITIPHIYLANIYQCDRFLSRIYSNA